MYNYTEEARNEAKNIHDSIMSRLVDVSRKADQIYEHIQHSKISRKVDFVMPELKEKGKVTIEL